MYSQRYSLRAIPTALRHAPARHPIRDRYYRALKSEIANKFGHDVVEVTPIRDPGKTGNFEVRIIGAPEELIHSKKIRNQGKCESEAEIDAVLDAIETFLEKST